MSKRLDCGCVVDGYVLAPCAMHQKRTISSDGKRTETQDEEMSTPTKGPIYLVSKGEYSSYRVVGLYTNEVLADRAASSLGITADGEVTEFPLNPGADELNQGLSLWHVIMRMEDGMIKHNGHIYRSREVTSEQETRVMDNGSIVGEVWARDKEHAIKVMNERRLQEIAGTLKRDLPEANHD